MAVGGVGGGKSYFLSTGVVGTNAGVFLEIKEAVPAPFPLSSCCKFKPLVVGLGALIRFCPGSTADCVREVTFGDEKEGAGLPGWKATPELCRPGIGNWGIGGAAFWPGVAVAVALKGAVEGFSMELRRSPVLTWKFGTWKRLAGAGADGTKTPAPVLRKDGAIGAAAGLEAAGPGTGGGLKDGVAAAALGVNDSAFRLKLAVAVGVGVNSPALLGLGSTMAAADLPPSGRKVAEVLDKIGWEGFPLNISHSALTWAVLARTERRPEAQKAGTLPQRCARDDCSSLLIIPHQSRFYPPALPIKTLEDSLTRSPLPPYPPPSTQLI